MFCLVGFFILAAYLFFFAWWADASATFLLGHYGFDFEGMNDLENYRNVSPQNLQLVQELERGRGGIGWPLKAIFACAYIGPLLALSYAGNWAWRKFKSGIFSK